MLSKTKSELDHYRAHEASLNLMADQNQNLGGLSQSQLLQLQHKYKQNINFIDEACLFEFVKNV